LTDNGINISLISLQHRILQLTIIPIICVTAALCTNKPCNITFPLLQLPRSSRPCTALITMTATSAFLSTSLY